MHKNIKRLNKKTHKKFENDFEIKNIVKHATCQCVLYILTSVWSPQHPNADRNNAENDYFDQRLECAAPKRLAKYTTNVSPLK